MIMLYEGRQTIDLGGLWEYKKEETDRTAEAFRTGELMDPEGWRPIRVPNNWYLTEIGDYFGTIWFRTSFQTPARKKNEHIWLRFGKP